MQGTFAGLIAFIQLISLPTRLIVRIAVAWSRVLLKCSCYFNNAVKGIWSLQQAFSTMEANVKGRFQSDVLVLVAYHY